MRRLAGITGWLLAAVLAMPPAAVLVAEDGTTSLPFLIDGEGGEFLSGGSTRPGSIRNEAEPRQGAGWFWSSSDGIAPPQWQLSKERVYSGAYAWRSVMNDPDQYRNEMKPIEGWDRDDGARFFRFAFTAGPDMTRPTASSWNVLSQWWQLDTSPPVGIWLYDDLRPRLRTKDDFGSATNENPRISSLWTDTEPVADGTWHNYMVKIKWGATDGELALWKWERDAWTPKYAASNTYIGYHDAGMEQGNYTWKLGGYRATGQGTWDVFYDEMKFAATQSEIEAGFAGPVPDPTITIHVPAEVARNQSDAKLPALAAGGDSLRKTGAGVLTLTESNRHEGPTSILEGTVAISNRSSLGRSSLIEISPGGVFDVQGMTNPYELRTGQQLAGGGTVVGSVTFSAGSTLSPGMMAPTAPALFASDVTAVVVPEPSAVVVTSIGLACLAATARGGRRRRLGTAGQRLAGIIGWLLAAVMAWAAGGRCQAAERPNIVLILADDVSPEMFGCYGSPDAKTPHLDRMAAEGVMFRTAWASALCSPARAEIMTGRYASRTGSWSNGLSTSQADGAGLFATHHSFAKLLQAAGYATAVAGKWHIHAAEHPGEPVVGFNEYCLWESQADLDRLPGRPRHRGAWEDEATPSRYWHPCIVRNHELVPTKPHDFGPTMFTDFLCDFMRRSAAAGKPFLAYYPMVAPHGTRDGHTTCPIYGEPGDMGGPREDRARRFRALVDHLDLLVGRLEQQARDLGVIDRTVFIFCSDNGTAVTAKSRGVERGCHVPMIVWGAGVKQRGSTDEICDLSDILPTLVDYAGGALPPGYEVDGRSLAPFLRGESDEHRDWILSCIGGTRLVRSRTHLLEVVCPILGVPEGRFYACGTSRDGRGYRRAEGDPAHAEVRRQFEAILERHPGLSADNPVFATPPAARWLRDYQAPAEREKHLHNHKNYQVYDETLAGE
jgi:autotransporter-associated beta strand protein